MIAIFQKLRDESSCQVARWGKQMSKYISIPRKNYFRSEKYTFVPSETVFIKQKRESTFIATKPNNSQQLTGKGRVQEPKSRLFAVMGGGVTPLCRD